MTTGTKYDDNAFYFFATTMLFFFVVPSAYYVWSTISGFKRAEALPKPPAMDVRLALRARSC